MNTVETMRCHLCDIAKATPCAMCARSERALCEDANRNKATPCAYYICNKFAKCYGGGQGES